MIRSLSYVARRGAAWLRRRLMPPLSPMNTESSIIPYGSWLQTRLLDRREEYPSVQVPGLFSLMTPVFDPPAGYFRVLAKSIFAQEHVDWQWVLIDNGCRNSDVLYLLDKYARDPRVTLVRAPRPLGIIGGMRLALEHATSRYVCPVDHDDRLYPDALRVVAASLQAYDWPRLAYTDEDKLMPDGQPGLPSFKPDWDPLLFLNACYIAHLGVMDRQRALELELYTDPDAEGTPDGDAFCRFLAAGHEPLHIPEIVYSWRMHEQSTAMLGVDAKPYVTANQKHVLSRYLCNTGLAEQIEVRTNSIPGLAGSWRVEAQGNQEAIDVCVLPGGSSAQRDRLRERLDPSHDIRQQHWLTSSYTVPDSLLDDEWVVLLSPECLPLTTDFVHEWKSVVAARPGTVLAGAVLQQGSTVVSAGLAWGMEGLLASPLQGADAGDLGIGQGSLCFQRSVSSVDARFCMVQAGFLREALLRSGSDLADPLLPAWLGALAREQNVSVVFTPHVVAEITFDLPERRCNDADRYRFLCKYGSWLATDHHYSRFMGLTAETAFQPVKPALRHIVLKRTLSALAGMVADYLEWAGSVSKYRSFLQEASSDSIQEEPRRYVA